MTTVVRGFLNGSRSRNRNSAIATATSASAHGDPEPGRLAAPVFAAGLRPTVPERVARAARPVSAPGAPCCRSGHPRVPAVVTGASPLHVRPIARLPALAAAQAVERRGRLGSRHAVDRDVARGLKAAHRRLGARSEDPSIGPTRWPASRRLRSTPSPEAIRRVAGNRRRCGSAGAAHCSAPCARPDPRSRRLPARIAVGGGAPPPRSGARRGRPRRRGPPRPERRCSLAQARTRSTVPIRATGEQGRAVRLPAAIAAWGCPT